MDHISVNRGAAAAEAFAEEAVNRRSVQKILVVSHVVHYQHEGQLYAYGPYAREIDIWADLFPEVVIAAPCRAEKPPGDALAFTRPNITIRPQTETGGRTLAAKTKQALALPGLIWGLSRAMYEADAIHVRYPGNLGILGVFLAPLFSRYLVAKYAGQWNSHVSERPMLRLQRAMLRSKWWRGPVTVYGAWPNEPPHIIPFFTSMMTSEQVERATEVAANKTISSPLRVLFSGRLAPEKRIDALLEAIGIATARGVRMEVALVGDGRERAALEEQVGRLGIEEQVTFVGAVPFDEALRWCEWAHCLVLPSTASEGWPKVIAEGMCHGLICVAVEHGQVPAMLKGRGILLKAGTAEEIAGALERVARHPDEFEPLMQQASRWARQYSLESLREALAELLTRQWKVALAPRAKAHASHHRR